MSGVVIPNALVQQIREGNVVLFLGAGALKGAKHPHNFDAPDSAELSKLLALRFLGHDYINSSLALVAELCISETGLFPVQKYIADYFNLFEPNDFHLKIPNFKWKSIVTTNYDLVIEKAYSKNIEHKQTLIKFVKDGRVNNLLKTTNDVPFLKLHGCISEINDEKIPLILTIDQYITHKKFRKRLFERLQEFGENHSFLFVGHSLEDSDIREVILNLASDLTLRMRSYIVAPNVKPEIERLWGQKKISVINSKFDDFINCLEDQIHQLEILSPATSKNITLTPLMQIIENAANNPSEILMNFIQNDIIFLHNTFIDEEVNAETFYKGYQGSWSPILNNLDIKRNIEDGILSEIFINSSSEITQDLYVLLGHAGSGKTTLLRRLAYDAFKTLDKKSFYLKDNVILNEDALIELYQFLKERIYLFVDNLNGNENEIIRLLEKCRKDCIPITIVSAERTNIWNVECSKSPNYLTHSYQLQYLTDIEIDSLLALLKKHNCLGYLKGKSVDIQRQELQEKAGRELLVALYETTQGKSFPEIVCDEFNSIPDEQAKGLYLTVCLLHSLGSYTRAGLLSRVHGVNFIEFNEKFFKPLEFLVFTKRDYYINEYIYESRHSLIAEFVIEGILADPQQRFDEYMRLLNNLDVDFDSDRNAFIYLTNAKKLLSRFKDPQQIRELYKTAHERSEDDPKLLQQEAIFEMESPGGSIINAENILTCADELSDHNDILIQHSLAELFLSKAERSTVILEKKKYLNETEKICIKLINNKKTITSHPYHTSIKAKLYLLKILIDNSDEYAIEKIIKDIEKQINNALQIFPDDSFILESEANLNTLLNNEPKALKLLEQAYANNTKSPYLSMRLASLYENVNIDKAIETIKCTLSTNPGDKDLNFKMALLLQKKNEIGELSNITHFLKRSFTQGDSRYHAKFWYARILYLNNEIKEANKIFQELSRLKIDSRIKNHVKGYITTDGTLQIFSGEIHSLLTNYGFIKRDQIGDTIYFHKTDSQECNDIRFSNLKRGQRVSFNIGFSYRGPNVQNLTIL